LKTLTETHDALLRQGLGLFPRIKRRCAFAGRMVLVRGQMVIWQTLANKSSRPLLGSHRGFDHRGGTTIADFADRSLGIGYAGGSLILLATSVLALLRALTKK
jgi:uncharacterized membrane-anchored protein